jgi:hypothetical protein
MKMPRRKIVFFLSAFSSREATAPVGILAVSTAVQRAGDQVRVIDSTFTPNSQQRKVVDVAVKGQGEAFPPLKPKVDGHQLSAEAVSC